MKRINTSAIDLNTTAALPPDEITVHDGKLWLHDGIASGGRSLGFTQVTGNVENYPPLTTAITPVELGSAGMDQQIFQSYDDNAFQVTLPFAVNFAGVNHTKIWVSSNSFVVFNDSDAQPWYIPPGNNRH
jgi:hypothetical protein